MCRDRDHRGRISFHSDWDIIVILDHGMLERCVHDSVTELSERAGEKAGGRTSERTDEWTDGRVNGRTSERTSERTSKHHFCPKKMVWSILIALKMLKFLEPSENSGSWYTWAVDSWHLSHGTTKNREVSTRRLVSLFPLSLITRSLVPTTRLVASRCPPCSRTQLASLARSFGWHVGCPISYGWWVNYEDWRKLLFMSRWKRSSKSRSRGGRWKKKKNSMTVTKNSKTKTGKEIQKQATILPFRYAETPRQNVFIEKGATDGRTDRRKDFLIVMPCRT